MHPVTAITLGCSFSNPAGSTAWRHIGSSTPEHCQASMSSIKPVQQLVCDSDSQVLNISQAQEGAL